MNTGGPTDRRKAGLDRASDAYSTGGNSEAGYSTDRVRAAMKSFA
jgi:hypothetical protein